MLSVPSRAYDNTFLNSIEGYRGNISKIGRLLLHEWWTVIDKEGKAHERYLFLFKSRVLICKVRKISDKRSIFVLQEIIKTPDCVVEEDNANALIRFTAKPNAKDVQHLPICLKPHNDNRDLIKKWYNEICVHIDKEVTLQEHKADDLRIDSTQILQETTINLPNKAEAYNPDTSVKASDVAKDHFLTKEEKERYQAEYQELLRLEQESIERYNKTKLQSYQTVQKTSVSATTETSQHSEIQQRTETISSVAQRTAGVEQKVSTQTQSLEEKERIVVRNDNIVEEQRSTNVTSSQETRTEVAATQRIATPKQELDSEIEIPQGARESPKLAKQPEPKRESSRPGKESPKPAKEETPIVQQVTGIPKSAKEPEPKQAPVPKGESPKLAKQPESKPKRESPKLTGEPEPKKESPKLKSDSPSKKSPPEPSKSTAPDTKILKQELHQELREEVLKTASTTTETLTETLLPAHPVEEITEDLGKTPIPTNESPAFTPEPLPVPQITVTQDIIPRAHKPIELNDIVGYQESIRQAAGGEQNPSGSGGQQTVYNITDSASLAQWNNRLYNIQMGRGGGAGGDGSDEPPQPPMPPHSVRMPGFFQPLPRISYETSIEILIVKAAPPPPPPPITLIPRVVVLNDALEMKSQNFLEGIYETDSFDTSLRTAKRKIKSIKSTVLKSKDSTKYAVDTVKKATARDFLHIFTPPIKQKRPIYEIVEEPSRASDVEDDYSESYYGEMQSEAREHSVARTEDHLSVTSRRHYESKIQRYQISLSSQPTPPRSACHFYHVSFPCYAVRLLFAANGKCFELKVF